MSESPNRREFMRGALCASAVIAVPSSLGCSSEGAGPGPLVVPEWQELADGIEASNACCWTQDQPAVGAGAGGPENHLPVITLSESGRVEVGFAMLHPMTPEHWITTMYVRDQDQVVIGLRDFGQISLKPQFTRDEEPKFSFQLPVGTTQVQAFSFCNLHDAWSSERVVV